MSENMEKTPLERAKQSQNRQSQDRQIQNRQIQSRPVQGREVQRRPVQRKPVQRTSAPLGNIEDKPRVHKNRDYDRDLQFDMFDLESDMGDEMGGDMSYDEYDIGEPRKKSKSSDKSGGKKSSVKSGTKSGKSGSKNSKGKKKMSKKARAAAARKRSRKRFLIFLGIYTAILLVLGIIFLGYTDSCLKKYKNAQPENEIVKYLEEFKTALGNGQIPAEVNLSSYGTAFDDASTITSEYLAFASQGELSFEKAKDSYNTEEPVYNILSGGIPIHSIKLKGVNERTIFGILTIMDWEKAESTCLYSPQKYEYYIRVPEGFTVELGGKVIDDSFRTESSSDIELFQFAREYVSLPAQVEYKVESYQELSGINIVDNNGNAVEGEVDGNIYTAFYKGSDDIPDEYRNLALTMSETWSKFMTADLTGSLHGFYTLEPYLIKGSYYYEKAEEYARGIDITFMSPHTLDEEPFSKVKVDNYVKYSDTCFSCHIYFEKVMHLNRGSDSLDVMDSTFIFAYYDDSDDGTDNPHWAIVDMIANTTNSSDSDASESSESTEL